MKSQLKIGVILSYAITIIQMIIHLLYTPIMLRLLGQSEYGLYTLVGSIVSYLSLCGLGLNSSYLRFYSRYKVQSEEKVATLNGMYMSMYFIISIVSLVLGTLMSVKCEYLLGDQITSSELKSAKIMMFILVINISVTFINTVFDSIITAHEKFLFQRLVRLVGVIANPLLALPLLIMGYRSLSIVIVTTIISIVSLMTNIIFCKYKIKAKIKIGSWDKLLFKEILQFTLFIFINIIIDQINWNVDKLLLGRFHGTVAVALYGIASQINNIDITISTSISSVFAPRVNNYFANGKSDEVFTNLFITTGRIQCLIMSLIDSGLVLFGMPFIRLWAGKGYDTSYYVMLCLVLPAFIPCIQNVGLEMQRAKNKHQFRSIAYLVMSIINICISIPLCKVYGAIGAAIGTTISLVFGNGIIMNWFYYKKLGLDIPRFWKNILKMMLPMIIPIICGISMRYIFDIKTWTEFIILGGIYVLIYGLCVWKLSMNEYEKNIILGLTSKIYKSKKKERI